MAGEKRKIGELVVYVPAEGRAEVWVQTETGPLKITSAFEVEMDTTSPNSMVYWKVCIAYDGGMEPMPTTANDPC